MAIITRMQERLDDLEERVAELEAAAEPGPGLDMLVCDGASYA